MIEIKNLTVCLKKNERTIIDNFSFTLNRSDKAVIIGEEGNGKSTLLKLIYKYDMVDEYCTYSGIVIKKGRAAYLPQTMDKKYNNLSLWEYFEDTEYYRYTGILIKLGLSLEFILSEQIIGTLSGGEKVKVQLAKLLMEEPDILLLDEPTNDLDIPTLRWLESFINECKTPILYISHDETLIENTANVIIHIEQIKRKTQCRISISRCSYHEYMTLRSNNFAHQDQVAKKQRDDYEKQMEKWRQIYNRVDHEQEIITRQDPGGARLLKKKMHSVLSMGRRFEREKDNFLDFPQTEEAILTRFDESICLPHGKTVLDYSCSELRADERVLSCDVRLHVSGSEHVGITGKNGVGKSTLLSCIWEELRDRSDIGAAFMPQNYSDALNFEMTPIEYLSENFTKEEVTRVRTLMGSMKFTHEEMTGKIGCLSGGQMAKILFLSMVLHGANVLLLDEPTRNFSPLSCPVVREALSSFGGAVISVSHDRKYLDEVCDKIYELREDGLFLVKQIN